MNRNLRQLHISALLNHKQSSWKFSPVFLPPSSETHNNQPLTCNDSPIATKVILGRESERMQKINREVIMKYFTVSQTHSFESSKTIKSTRYQFPLFTNNIPLGLPFWRLIKIFCSTIYIICIHACIYSIYTYTYTYIQNVDIRLVLPTFITTVNVHRNSNSFWLYAGLKINSRLNKVF